MSVFEHVEFDQHECLEFFHDAASGLKAIVAVHNSSRGPALGGCRMWHYPDEQAAINDVLRLSKGMTYKSALANIDLGGGKSVIIGDPRRHKTEALMEAMGRCLERMGGYYIAAEDSGTSVTDLKVMGRRTAHVAGITERTGIDGNPCDGDPSPATAYGVFVGLRAAVKHRLERDNLRGLKVAVQGVGNVGFRLAQHLSAAGAELFVSDIHPELVERAVTELGAIAVESEQVLALDVDVLAPCALGAVLNDQTIPQIRARVIAGAANNQLAAPRHDAMLRQRDILYTPDYAINAGGIIDVFYERVGHDHQRVLAHIESIAETLEEIFQRADADDLATGAVADQLARERFQPQAALL